MAIDQTQLLGNSELYALYISQAIPSNLANPPSLVPIHKFSFPSMAIDQITLSGNSELEVLYIVQFVPSNFANPPP